MFGLSNRKMTNTKDMALKPLFYKTDRIAGKRSSLRQGLRCCDPGELLPRGLCVLKGGTFQHTTILKSNMLHFVVAVFKAAGLELSTLAILELVLPCFEFSTAGVTCTQYHAWSLRTIKKKFIFPQGRKS